MSQLSFSPNSRQLFSRAESIEHDWGDARLWDLESGEPLSLPSGLTRATAAAWSADGSLLAVGDANGHIAVVNASSREHLADIQVDAGDVIDMAFSPEADRLAIAAGNQLSLWSLTDQPQCLGRFEHPLRIARLQYSPAGDHVSSLCSDAGARLFHIANGALAPPHIVRASVWRPTSWDAMVPLYPRFVNSGKTWTVFSRLPHSVEGGGADSMLLIDVDSGKTRDIPLKGGRVVEISPNERCVFDAFHHGTIISLTDGAKLGSYEPRPMLWAVTAAFHPDGALVLVGSGERTVTIRKVPELTVVTAPIEHPQSVNCLAVAPNGRWFATADSGGTVRMWAFPTGPETSSVRFHPHAQSHISFADISRDGRYAVATGRTSKGNELTVTRVVELATAKVVGPPLSPGAIILGGRSCAIRARLRS